MTETTEHQTATGCSTFTWDEPTTSGPGPQPSPAWADPDTLEIQLLAANHSPADVAARIGRTPEAVAAKLDDPIFATQLVAARAMQGLWAVEDVRARLPGRVRQVCALLGAPSALLYRQLVLENLDKLEQQLEQEQERAWAQQENLLADKEAPDTHDTP